jgi:hypothetical protein
MFVGHFAAGFGAKAVARPVSLGTLLLGAQFIDLLWPTLLLLGIEQVRIAPGTTVVTPLDFTHYPISHSLLGVACWGAVVGGVYWLARRQAVGALVVGLLVVSHWGLDAIVHRPDLPLAYGDSLRVGLGLWNSLPATLLVEGGLLVVGVWLYLRTTRARNRIGALGFWALVGLLVLIHATNLAGPPPPSVAAIAWAGQLQWLLVAMGWWVDRNREPARAQRLPARVP